MSTTLIKKPKIMVHPLDDAGRNNNNNNNNNNKAPNETTQLIVPSSSSSSTTSGNNKELSYPIIFFLMLNRSINLVLYKAFTTFSYYFSEYFGMNYTVFALIAVMNFPGNLLNIAVVPYYHQFRVRYVIICFELILAASCLLILPWHTVTGLLIARLMTGFAITAARSEVNATIGAFTHNTRSEKRRTKAIGIVEMSFGFSAMGFLIVGIVLQHLGWRVFFGGSAILIVLISIAVLFIIPPWYIDNDNAVQNEKVKQKKKYSYLQLRETLMHKRLQLVFLSVLLNKIARNAFYYTFSKWLSLQYGLGPQQAGYITLCVAGGCLIGTTIVPLIVTKLGLSIHLTCLFGALMQVFSMSTEPIYVLFGKHVGLFGACIIIFFYFCGCQIWYNNILDIMIGVTPRPKLLPAVNTILLAYGAFGGMIGTIGSTVWYQWGGEVAIATICAASNIGVSCIVILLWIAHKQHPYLPKQSQQPQTQQQSSSSYGSTKIIADSSSMALKIVDAGSITPKQSQSNLQNIDEHQTLLNQDNDINDANKF